MLVFPKKGETDEQFIARAKALAELLVMGKPLSANKTQEEGQDGSA